ncbi:hypothetical protein [Phenylobacterium sp.]|uniref:hypothetical protein n=1 Tax=Phenylobacterium sp. TaxID=1871053 RepID=UPI00286B82B4|nr:hypothetical protein [Phenylobacterium sp.]
MAVAAAVCAAGSAAADDAVARPTAAAPSGWSFKPDAGYVYQSGDFKLTTWGFAERLFDPGGHDAYRRVRQGAEVDFPPIASGLRPALVYEIDLTDSNFFDNGIGGRSGFGRRDFENLFIALQDPDDPGRFRVLIGENTHILSRDDNLSSGNLATINRSLILEEHGSVNSFGTQFGVQVQKAFSDNLTLQLSAQDNRGSFNTPEPRYRVGNSLAAKMILTPLNDPGAGRKLSLGLALDRTGSIRDRTFTLATAIAQTPLGGVAATGNKLTWEADAAYTFPLAGHPTTVEGELIYSSFSQSRSAVGGGYAMLQWSAFETPRSGDLDLFLRYDLVSLEQDSIVGRATQRAIRTGANYNLPYTRKLANLHLEYAHNTVSGPAAIVTGDRLKDEFRVELRISLQQYVRH